jgi:hypothetical protein
MNLSRALTRKLYNKIRSEVLLGKSSKLYTEMLKFIEKYPDIKPELKKIKMNMAYAIKDRDQKSISSCIHDIYTLSKEISKREKSGVLFDLNDEEKLEFKNKYEDREKNDPYGEEDWNN